jgi:hypothetical protein
MIIARTVDAIPTITEPPSSAEERARALAALEEFEKNVEWFGLHAKEIRDTHTGKFMCIMGQELFVGDDPIEVVARASTAHPETPDGSFSMRLLPHRGPKIYAN